MRRIAVTPPETEAMICACAMEHPAWSIRHIHKTLLDSGVPVSYPTLLKLLKKNLMHTKCARYAGKLVITAAAE